MSDSEKIDPWWHEAFLAAYATKANISTGCKAVGISRSTFYDHRDAFPDFARRCEEIREARIDGYEQRLGDLAMAGDITAIIFALKTLRRTSFGDKLHVTSSVQVEVRTISAAEQEAELAELMQHAKAEKARQA